MPRFRYWTTRLAKRPQCTSLHDKRSIHAGDSRSNFLHQFLVLPIIRCCVCRDYDDSYNARDLRAASEASFFPVIVLRCRTCSTASDGGRTKPAPGFSPRVRSSYYSGLEKCPRSRIEVTPTALPHLHALESVAAAGLDRLRHGHASRLAALCAVGDVAILIKKLCRCRETARHATNTKYRA